MASAMQITATPVNSSSDSKAWIWAGRIVTTLVVLFLIFDGVTKVIKEPHVVAASAEFGYSANAIALIGALLLALTVLYVIPRTSVFGALLLTGYLGGAVEANIRIGHPVFECIFPILFAVLVWGGIFVREPRLRHLIPFRS